MAWLMNRKTLIFCVSVTGVFLIIVAAALYFLYSGTGDSKSTLSDVREYMLFSAVPSDAACVLKFEDFEELLDAFDQDESSSAFFLGKREESGKMAGFLDDVRSSSSLYSSLLSSQAVMSLHNIGTLASLLVIDAGKYADEPSEDVSAFVAKASDHGLSAMYADASEYVSAGNPLRKRALLMISPSDILIQSSLRHLKSEVSVLDCKGFPESVEKIRQGNVAVIPDSGIPQLARNILSPGMRPAASFCSLFADCTAFGISENTSEAFSMTGVSYSEGSRSDFISVFNAVTPGVSEISAVLPSYTLSAVCVSFADVSEYAGAYRGFVETKSLSRDIDAVTTALKKKAGYDPVVWAEALDLKEVGAASFYTGGNVEKILVARLGRLSEEVIFKGLENTDKDNSEGKIMDFRYGGFLKALFGPMFSLSQEQSFILHDSWLIIGSAAALSEYISGRALDYSLQAYLADAGIDDGFSGKDNYFTAYLSLSEDSGYTGRFFSSDFMSAVKASAEGCTFEPLFFSVAEGKSGIESRFRFGRTTVLKSQAPTFERNTEVEIPQGPFRVKNSGTGKMNLFYQQKNMYLCLQEENGKGLWGVPFDTPICGCAQTVDYYANGKLQILFASGSRLYLIDRLHRFVKPFPVDLGKEILVGPDVYDFSGRRKYNVMVLHKDNTIEMYNLQGRRPAEWKTIRAGETIKGLPERIRVGGSSYWVVRTSIQTLIFAFYGGDPLTVFSGDRMIRPDSEVTPSGDDSVEVICYDGKKHTVKLVR